MCWILDNLLALYAAVVGTIALGLNFARYRYTVNQGKVKLKVLANRHPDIEANKLLLKGESGKATHRRHGSAIAFEITIINTGSTQAYIAGAGVLCTNDKEHTARNRNANIEDLSGPFPITIEPNNRTELRVDYISNQEFFKAKKAYVVDATGKRTVVKIP